MNWKTLLYDPVCTFIKIYIIKPMREHNESCRFSEVWCICVFVINKFFFFFVETFVVNFWIFVRKLALFWCTWWTVHWCSNVNACLKKENKLIIRVHVLTDMNKSRSRYWRMDLRRWQAACTEQRIKKTRHYAGEHSTAWEHGWSVEACITNDSLLSRWRLYVCKINQ